MKVGLRWSFDWKLGRLATPCSTTAPSGSRSRRGGSAGCSSSRPARRRATPSGSEVGPFQPKLWPDCAPRLSTFPVLSPSLHCRIRQPENNFLNIREGLKLQVGERTHNQSAWVREGSWRVKKTLNQQACCSMFLFLLLQRIRTQRYCANIFLAIFRSKKKNNFLVD